MPDALPRLCRTQNCNCTVIPPKRYCKEHERLTQRAFTLKRNPVVLALYRTAKHLSWRRRVLARDPLCKMCGHAMSTEADHIIPLVDGGDYSMANGQGLCATCHSIKSGKEQAARGAGVHERTNVRMDDRLNFVNNG